jgi:hypothetical protein
MERRDGHMDVGKMKTTVAILSLGIAAGNLLPSAHAQVSIGETEQSPAYVRVATEVEGKPYDVCRKDAFDYGVMGHYRRLYILSCLDTDVTSTNRNRD